MKTWTISFFILILTVSACFSQTPQAVESDLYNSFKRVDYWFQKKNEASSAPSAYDSLVKANNQFGKKLESYAQKFPFTITQKFTSFQKDRSDIYALTPYIYTSSDNLFKIYSWDTWTGGTMHIFENVFQYKSGSKTFSILDTAKSGEDYTPSYDTIFTFKTGRKTYYLCPFTSIFSTKDMSQGIQVFSIENGRLNKDSKLIKTKSGLHSQLSVDFDFFSEVDLKVRPKVYFDPNAKKINLPLVDENDKMTHRYIVYKFTGEYFKRVKN